MGPGDPFAARKPSAPTREAPTRLDEPPPLRAPPGRTTVSAPSAADALRVQARLPDPVPSTSTAPRHAVLIGALVGLVASVLVIAIGIGPALVALLCTAIGAALGLLVKNAFADGVDVGAAWRALRRH